MVLRVQAGSVALGVVAPTVLLARLVCTSVSAGVQESGEKGQEGHHLQSMLLAKMCTNTLPLPR